MLDNFPTRNLSLIGVADVHYVASELSLRGMIALPTIRNTAGMDIVVLHPDLDFHAELQVKTSRSKVGFWPVEEKYKSWVGENKFYIFVRYLKNEAYFDVFLESSELVAKQLKANIEIEQKKGLVKWAPCWYLRGDEDRLRKQWLDFGKHQDRKLKSGDIT